MTGPDPQHNWRETFQQYISEIYVHFQSLQIQLFIEYIIPTDAQIEFYSCKTFCIYFFLVLLTMASVLKGVIIGGYPHSTQPHPRLVIDINVLGMEMLSTPYRFIRYLYLNQIIVQSKIGPGYQVQECKECTRIANVSYN